MLSSYECLYTSNGPFCQHVCNAGTGSFDKLLGFYFHVGMTEICSLWQLKLHVYTYIHCVCA